MRRVYTSRNWMIRRVEGHTRIVPTKDPYAVTDGPSDRLNDRILKKHAQVKRLQIAFRHPYVGVLTKCYSLLRCAEGFRSISEIVTIRLPASISLIQEDVILAASDSNLASSRSRNAGSTAVP